MSSPPRQTRQQQAAQQALGTTIEEFSLGLAKQKTSRNLPDNTPQAFRKFFLTATFDRLCQVIIIYFCCIFQHDWVVKSMEKARKHHLDGYNSYTVADRLNELEEDIQSLRLQISPIYSQIILMHSTYEKPQQDRLFFESLYESLIGVTDEAFSRMQKRPDIEREIGSLFRSRHFNMYKRKNQPSRSVDSLTVKELYSVKNETTNRALNSKLLSSLFEKPEVLGVQVASVTNSLLVTQYVSSPIVARSMMKDPEAREKILAKTLDLSEGKEKKSIGNVFKMGAMMRGVDPSKLRDKIKTMEMTNATKTSLGIETDRKATKHLLHQKLAPESAGLPVDDAFNQIANVKRVLLGQYSPGFAAPSQSLPPINSPQHVPQHSHDLASIGRLLSTQSSTSSHK